MGNINEGNQSTNMTAITYPKNEADGFDEVDVIADKEDEEEKLPEDNPLD